jgi:hypothetical protein
MTIHDPRRGKMMRSVRPLAAIALLSLVAPSFVPSQAWAQSDSDRATARDLGQAGQAALDAKDFKRAEEAFRRADALFHAPTLAVGLARAQAGQGRFVEAWENYHRVILENVTSPPAFAKALAEAQAEIGSVESRRARVTIAVPGVDAPKVTIDDVPVRAEALGVERSIDPGPHVFKASADGYTPTSQTVTIPEGGAQNVTLTLQKGSAAVVAAPVGAVSLAGAPPGPAASPTGTPAPATTEASSSGGGSGMKTAGFVSLGVGGAGLIEGVITGILALSKHSTLKSECPNGTCSTTTADSDLSTYHTVGTLSTVGFIVAGVGAAAGVTLILVAPKGAPSAPATGLRVTPYVGFGAAGAMGTF